MTPEATFFQSLFSGQIPFGVALLALISLVLSKGSTKMERIAIGLETLVTATIASTTAAKADSETKARDLASHVSREVDRVIDALGDHRISTLVNVVDEVGKRVDSIHDAEPSRPTRQPTGSQRLYPAPR